MSGALGRMGRRIVALAQADDAFVVSDLLEAAGHAALGTDPGLEMGLGDLGVTIGAALSREADVCIDFTRPEGCLTRIAECREKGVPIVVGTTGLGDAGTKAMDDAAQDIPVLYARNMSTGIATLCLELPNLIRRLGDGVECEIVETHHGRKIDAPSGTALALAEACAAGLGRSMDDAVYGRKGETGVRPEGQIGIHAVRGGEVAGVHEVRLYKGAETIEIVHRAANRDVFAAGALRAAAFLATQKPGKYTIFDVVSGG
jgi:4-hydroxy-tetrahydrodipicolinate reductase